MADVEEPVEPQAEEAEAVEEPVEEEEILATTTDVKLFGKWSFDDIEISDLSLEVSVPGVPIGYHTMDLGKCLR